jgi:hypothetical protein
MLIFKSNKIFWICGRWPDAQGVSPWYIQGIFDTEKKAIAACIDKTYFIGSLKINTCFPRNLVQWEGCYYPIK